MLCQGKFKFHNLLSHTDGQYYRYTRGYGLDAGYPRSISVWSNELPNTIDAVIHVENVGTYFFSENMFYIVDDYNLQVGKISNVFYLDSFLLFDIFYWSLISAVKYGL